MMKTTSTAFFLACCYGSLLSIAIMERKNGVVTAFTIPTNQLQPTVARSIPFGDRTSHSTSPRFHASSSSPCTKIFSTKIDNGGGTNGQTQPINSQTDNNDNDNDDNKRTKKRTIPKLIAKAYVNYVKRLWAETAPEQRRIIASQQASAALKKVQHLMDGEEYIDLMSIRDGEDSDAFKARIDAMDKTREACGLMLECIEEKKMIQQKEAIDEAMKKKEDGTMPTTTSSTKEVVPQGGENGDKSVKKKKEKKSRSILFGSAMGAIVACWVFSGNYIFTGLFTLMTALGQLEYYRMVMNTGIYPARKISVLGACAMFITALCAPNLHQICLPVFASIAMVWFLSMRRKVSTISEIATTFTGMFYLGYIPSFWVRIRAIGSGREPTRLAPIVKPMLDFIDKTGNTRLPKFLPKSIQMPITTGAVFVFWTWLSIAFSDVGAYFTGRAFGKTKLGDVFPAAGEASPNKTLEGFIGGTVACAMFASVGAWVQRWPYWFLTGPFHGVMLAFLGLIGDLTASMLKRDAGLKDFGDLLPEHGGIMDRVDSFIFTAPYSWVMCQYIIPALKVKSRLAIP